MRRLSVWLAEHTPKEHNYHTGLRKGAGYLEAQVVSGEEGTCTRYDIGPLTCQGREALTPFRGSQRLADQSSGQRSLIASEINGLSSAIVMPCFSATRIL